MNMGKLNYGVVLIIKGKYQGRFMYFDDDNDYDTKGIVYMGLPFLYSYIEIPYNYMRNVSDEEIKQRILELRKLLIGEARIRSKYSRTTTDRLNELVLLLYYLVDFSDLDIIADQINNAGKNE